MAYSTPIPIDSFDVQNWVVVPVVKPKGTSILMVLTGVVNVDLSGTIPDDWRRETILIAPDTSAPIHYALEHFQLPNFGLTLPNKVFVVDQGAPFAAVSSVVDRAGRAGFAVDQWRLHGDAGTDRIFSGVEVDVAVLNDHAEMYRVSYNITLEGRIVGVEGERIAGNEAFKRA